MKSTNGSMGGNGLGGGSSSLKHSNMMMDNRKDFDSISTLPPFNTENNQAYFDVDDRRGTGEIVDFRSLAQELSFIRNSQNMIFREIEKLRNDLKVNSNSNNNNNNNNSPSSRLFRSSSLSSSSSSLSADSEPSDALKYKDLKKKLLLANLRIMDLQNKQQ